jgi:hypothetical protein
MAGHVAAFPRIFIDLFICTMTHAMNDALDKEMLRSLSVVAVISVCAVEFQNLVLDSVLGLLILFLM